ncbi:MAG: Thiamine-phosphate pyrophosphorylase [Planctomycetota bacterium]
MQWRTKGRHDDQLPRAIEICTEHGVPVVVNDDVALAATHGVGGLHVGQDDAPVAAARARLGRRWIGVSTHDLEQLARAHADGADYVGFGPCNATATKGYAVALPDDLIAAAAAAAQVPLFAIGGITPTNLPRLLRLGIRRIAVSAAILAAEDPRAASQSLRGLLEGAPKRST